MPIRSITVAFFDKAGTPWLRFIIEYVDGTCCFEETEFDAPSVKLLLEDGARLQAATN